MMAYKKYLDIISAKTLRNHFNCMHTGSVLYEEKEKKWLVWQKKTWVWKYFIISKGAKDDSVWNIHCFKECESMKQDWSISMREVESIRECGMDSENNFIGIRIILNDHERPVIILKNDTEKNRQTWMSMLSQAYAESQQLAADSGFGSGGSVIGRNRNESDGKPTTESDGNLYSYAENEFPAQEKKDANLNTRETSGLYESFSQIPATNGVTGEYTRETDETNVKKVVSSPVQETKCSPNVLTRCTNIGKTEDESLPTSNRLPVSTRGTYSGQVHKAENNFSEETRECEGIVSLTEDHSLSAFVSVDSCSDSFDSVEQRKFSFDSKSKCIGKADSDGKSDCFITKENTLKSLEVQKNPAYDKDSRKHKVVPDQQKYSKSSISSLAEFDRDEQEQFDDDDVNICQPSMSDSCNLAIYTGPTEAESTPRNLPELDTDKQKSNDVERNEIYANVACFKDVEQNDFSFDGNERKKESDDGTNCNIHNTPSADSFSSTESETPDEDAIYQNTNFFQKQDHYCEGNENDKRNLKKTPAGTFMTYDTGTDLKLCVSTDIGIKKFRIYQQGGNVSVFKDFSDRVHIFPNLDHFFLTFIIRTICHLTTFK